MRLQVKHSKPKGKTEKQKKINKEKKSKGPKISKNYNDTSEFKVGKAEIDLTRLTYGIIDSCNAKYIELPDGVITLNQSWIELVILMIANVIENNPDNFLQILGENNVTNQTFSIDSMYGKYSFDKDKDFKVYNIYNTKYYLEAIFSKENLFSAIVGLSKINEIALNEFKIGIERKDYNEVKLNFDLLEDTESIVKISGVASMVKQGIHLVGISLMGVSIEVHRMDVALWHFCNWVHDNYGEMKLMTLPKYSNTGVSLKGTQIDKAYMQIRGGAVSVYTDGDTEGIIRFIKDSMKELEIGEEHIKFKFRALKKKSELKEWEVD